MTIADAADAKIMAVMNQLLVNAGNPTPQAMASFCGPTESLGGCSKYNSCDLHPTGFKGMAISDIKENHPHVYAELQAARCLRTTINDNRGLFVSARLAAADYFGAHPPDNVVLSAASRVLTESRCAYDGCVVPELADVLGDVKGRNDRTFDESCPYGYTRSLGGELQRNPYRLVACELTRREFLELQQSLGVLSISPIVILPGLADTAADVVYISKDPSARYQYLSLCPSALGPQFVPMPEEGARLQAPRLVRHTLTESGSDLRLTAKDRTFRSLDLSDHTLSPFERRCGVRYVPAGEFVFLCALWIWTGERKRPSSSEQTREVHLESSHFAPHGAMLLTRLESMGYREQLRRIYGDFSVTNRAVVRRSTRLDDLMLLGLLTDVDGEFALTPRAHSLTTWFGDAFTVWRSAAQDVPPQAISKERIRKLFGDGLRKTNHAAQLLLLYDELQRALTAADAAGWVSALTSILDMFVTTRRPGELRRALVNTHFPAYPVVHLTLLSGFTAPIDWLAIPLGGPIGPSLDNKMLPPQAGAFVLARGRTSSECEVLVNKLRPLIAIPVFAESALWIDDVVRRKQATMSLGAVLVARSHEVAAVEAFLRKFGDPTERAANLLEAFQSTTERDGVATKLGYVFSLAKLAVMDARFAETMRARNWRVEPELLSLRSIIRDAWEVITPLDRSVGREPFTTSGVRNHDISVPRAVALHLCYEVLLNIVRHDERPPGVPDDGRIVYEITRKETRLWVRFWNSWSSIPADVQLRMRTQPPPEQIKGLYVLALLASMADCEYSIGNAAHPVSQRNVGFVRLGFRLPQRD